MTRFRRVRWIAITALVASAVVTFGVGAEAFADRGQSACQSVAHSPTTAGDHSWRTGGVRSAGCRAWRHLHHQTVMLRIR
jgi:hypothetical protein